MKRFSFDDLFPAYADGYANFEHDAGNDSFTVRASAVFNFLRVEASFDEWFKSCSAGVELTKGKDYIEVESDDLPIDYLISNDLAMHFCLISDCKVSILIGLFIVQSSELLEKLMSTQNRQEFVKIHTQYIEYRRKLRNKINAG